MHLLFCCILKISGIMLGWQVEGSSSYQAEWLLLKVLKGFSDFRRGLSTLSAKRALILQLFQHWEKAQYCLNEILSKRPLEKAQIRFHSTVLKLFLMTVVCCYALLILAVCNSSRIPGKQHHRHKTDSIWWDGHKSLRKTTSAIFLISHICFSYTQYN